MQILSEKIPCGFLTNTKCGSTSLPFFHHLAPLVLVAKNICHTVSRII
jgi:hypothetical protein